jgi:hypothetical protein
MILFTWEWVKPGFGNIMDAAIIHPFYRLTPGPPLLPHSYIYLKREQLSRLTNLGFEVFVLPPSLIIFGKNQE